MFIMKFSNKSSLCVATFISGRLAGLSKVHVLMKVHGCFYDTAQSDVFILQNIKILLQSGKHKLFSGTKSKESTVYPHNLKKPI